ncbi:hypothetical protein [Novosphingobium humi]|uniref:Uncharacterized protein n=1 Tax=Novosphingobium humi TaxID=2282397 RepID=A0ABY7U055_9SPHN|nr:hypothetical protein [Novosphingobium humi]WCT78903.1 hypothetical protein PQ457_08075 [Novosphingobium humi]
MTYMATIIHLAQSGHLTRFDPGLDWRQQEERCIYLLPSAKNWMRDVLPNEISDFGVERTPIEQVASLLENFCAGKALAFPRQFHPLVHIDSGIWQLKTADVRLFGWFCGQDQFICSNGDMATRIKKNHWYERYRDEAIGFRDILALDDPKFVAGGQPDDVVSAYHSR